MIAKISKISQYKNHTWYINTAAFYHMTFVVSLFDIIRPSTKETELTDRTLIRAMNVKTITLSILVDSEILKQPLYEIYHMSELNNNLLSVKYLEKKSFSFKVFNERLQIRERKEVKLKVTQVDTLYVLNQLLNLQIIMIKRNTHNIDT